MQLNARRLFLPFLFVLPSGRARAIYKTFAAELSFVVV
jgi:hypothetical protein